MALTPNQSIVELENYGAQHELAYFFKENRCRVIYLKKHNVLKEPEKDHQTYI